jgi:hypothetical protein
MLLMPDRSERLDGFAEITLGQSYTPSRVFVLSRPFVFLNIPHMNTL